MRVLDRPTFIYLVHIEMPPDYDREYEGRILKWCYLNLDIEDWFCVGFNGEYYFKNESDAVFFELTWG